MPVWCLVLVFLLCRDAEEIRKEAIKACVDVLASIEKQRGDHAEEKERIMTDLGLLQTIDKVVRMSSRLTSTIKLPTQAPRHIGRSL